jgi:hypothetical protein
VSHINSIKITLHILDALVLDVPLVIFYYKAEKWLEKQETIFIIVNVFDVRLVSVY